MQSRLPAFCNPVATHASTWDAATAGLSVPLNIKLDGRIVPSPASPDGARVDFSHVIVLDGLFGEQERSGLWQVLIGDSASSDTASPAQQLAQANLAASDHDSPTVPMPMANAAAPENADHDPAAVNGQQPGDGAVQIPPLDRWERRTADRAGLPGTWGLKPHMLDILARGQIPAAVEVQTRLAKLFPEFIVAHMPTDAIQTSTAASSSDEGDGSQDPLRDQPFDLPERNGKVSEPGPNSCSAGDQDPACCPLSHDAAHEQQQQQSCAQEQEPGDLWKPASSQAFPSFVSCDQASPGTPGSSPPGPASKTSEQASGVVKQAVSSQHGLTEPASPNSTQRSEPDRISSRKSEDAVAAEDIPAEDTDTGSKAGHCSAFLGNAAVHGDSFQWHVDADPSDFAFPSPWTDIYGHYCNREPGQPLFVSLLLYLDADWPRDFAAETLFLDADTDVGLAVRPKPYRAILMDQDVLHRVSAPSMLAGQRPRFSLVWKLLFYPRSSSTLCSIARHEWGPSACIGSAAKVQQVITSLAGKRKCPD